MPEAGPARGAKGSSRHLALLTLAVHLDAALAAPRRYALAAWWRLRGKRVRARAQFAPLLGKSPRAYRLWLARQVPEANESPGPASPQVVALVDAGAEAHLLPRTLHSLAEAGVPALVIGGEGESLAEAAERIDWARDPWLLPLAAGDVLAAAAAAGYRRALAGTAARIAYADDDLLDDRGQRAAPHFKPDWNSELFRHHDYLTGACMVRATKAELLAAAAATDWAGELARTATRGSTPVHVRQVLHHRRARPQPVAPPMETPRTDDLPPVSVIVPTRNRADLLRTCMAGLAQADYPGIEIIVIDNGSDDPETLALLAALETDTRLDCRVLRMAGPFNFSALNNRAVQEAGGDLLCLLNNDIEMLDAHWLAVMARQALRQDVGAVGARLLYPDRRRIQHAGVVLGVGGGAAHAHRFVRDDEEGYFRRHRLPQFVSAVTAACLVVRRDRFLAVDGLDEQHFPVAFNDVDLCLRLNRRGWQSLYEPRATLVHHESVSRGLDRDPAGARRLAAELAALKRIWGTQGLVDPWHHAALSPFSEQFTIGL